jgi:hypothetical protein
MHLGGGGDFNLVRYQKEKSNGMMNLRWCEKINAWIDTLGMLEINLLGRSFTWSNNQALHRNPRGHVSILWESG